MIESEPLQEYATLVFKVISWNVNSISSRLERLLGLLKREKPDVICLQELKCVDEKFPTPALEALGYHCAVFGQKTYNGVAILSKVKPKDIRRGFREDSSRIISADIGGIRIISAYFPNGQAVGTEKYAYKLDWMKYFGLYLKESFSPTDRLILAGDLNVAPEDRDVHDPTVWRGRILFSEPEKKALEEIKQFGLIDTLRLHHHEGGLYSWWDYRELSFPFNKGLRIDFVLVTAPLAKACIAASILRDERKGTKPSDHAPVMAEFTLG